MPHKCPTRLLMTPSDHRWLTFVDSDPNSSIFHHPAWINLVAECYGYRPFVVAVCNKDGAIKAGLPMMEVKSSLTGRRWISLPFTDHCHPLYYGNSPPREMFEFLAELQAIHAIPRIEIRSSVPHYLQVHELNNFVLHQLRLSADEKAVFRNFHRSVKENIRRAERDGVRVQWGSKEHDLDVFYDLLWRTRHRLGVPTQPKRFFDLLWERIINAGRGFVLLASIDDVPIAGAVFLMHKTTLVVKYSASDRDYWRLRANYLLTWTAIRWACQHGYSLLDRGRCRKSNTGLRDFKKRWDMRESILTYSDMSDMPPNDIADRLSDVARPFIRHAPRWISRITGELLYKHFA